MRHSLPLTAAALVTTGLIGAVHAQNTPYDLRDMVGARAGQAEGELQRRGYSYVRGQTGDDRKWAYWWNADRRLCVSIATINGRYDSIVTAPASDCRQQAGGGPPDQPDRPDRPGWEDNRPGRPDRPGAGGPGG